MNILDIRTIMIGYVLTNLVCLLVMSLLWRQSRGRIAGTAFWLIDYAFQATALLLIVMRGAIPDWMSIVLSHTLILTGAMLGYIGLLRFTGERVSQTPNILLIGFFAAIHGYFTFVSPDLGVRTMASSLGLLIICMQCAWLLLYKVAPAERKTTKMVGVIFALYCLVAAARIVEFLAGRPARADFFQPGASDAMAALAYQILFIFLTYTLMLMFNKRLIEDIQAGEEKFSRAFRSSPYAETISRLSDGMILEVNESFLDITGYRKEEVQGKTSFDLNLWRREEDRAEVVRELSQNRSVRNREYLFRKKNGEILSCIFSAELITVHHEVCILSSINDVSDRKKIEIELQKSELLLRSVMDNLPIGVAVNSVDPSVQF
ncbi:MAG TPA: PAS domain S-box protein, partial [Smithellaceae bacterium]|nr:PAS domain S-box protein [Smithellaceae bacterium]